MKKYDEDAISHFLRVATQERVKIAPRSPADEREALINVQLSRDNMSASVTVEPPFFTKPWPKREDILNAMRAKSVTFGLDEEAIGKIADLRIDNDSVVVAQGRPAENGKNAWIERLIDPTRAPEVDETAETIDHRKRSAIINVHQGDRIAVKHPATPGVDGMNVVGAVLPAKQGKDLSFSAGAGLAPEENDPLSLIATLDGRLVDIAGKLQVMPELEIDGDVDFGVGNIDFTGLVRIKGAVREGFKVLSEGDIEIHQLVEAAHVESSGNITIHGGVRGMGKARIVAAGSITMGFAEQAHIVSGGDVHA
ncbi:MAG: DUF342 domain-containing protein, partial [Fretibacterium sp.]|nr:DUF342 domain-containing protein [Fretibacterium sp.]